MAANYPWPDPNAPKQQGFSLPVSIGPMSLPVEKPKRRWRGLVAWCLCLFAVGVATGPLLTEYTYRGIEAAGAFMAVNAPSFLRPYLPLPVDPSAAPVVAPRSSPGALAPAVAVAPEAEPAGVVVAAESDKAEPAPERLAAAEPTARSGKGKHGKSGGKASAVAPAPAEPAPAGRKPGKSQDPFDTTAAKREAKTAPAPTSTKSEPAARPSKTADGLDSLMLGGTTDEAGKGKGQRSASKDIDAMLKGVQKSEPTAAAPKRTEKTADLPQLTSSDIARVMGGVKTRANACGKRLNQKGVAELKLTVGKDGRITDVSVGGKVAGTPLAECVEKAARTATFQPNAGLRFDYRIDVR